MITKKSYKTLAINFRKDALLYTDQNTRAIRAGEKYNVHITNARVQKNIEMCDIEFTDTNGGTAKGIPYDLFMFLD